METRETVSESHFCSFRLKSISIVIALLFLVFCKNSPRVVWTFQTGGYIYGSPALSGSLLIIGSADHHLYALDKNTGKQVWESDLGERVSSKPLMDHDSIYIGNGRGDFFCVNAKDGKTKWKIQTGRDPIHYGACMDGDSVYFGSYNDRFYKVSKAGQIVWSWKGGSDFRGDCAVYQDLVLTSCMDKHFYGLDRETGQPRWKVDSDHHNFGGPELAGNIVYFSTHDRIYKLEARSGKVLGQFNATYVAHTVPLNGFLWSFESNGLVKRKLDGQPVGTAELQAFDPFRPVVADRYFIVAGTKNMLYGVSFEPKIIWKYKGKDYFWASGIISEGIYYTGNRDGRVYALRLPK